MILGIGIDIIEYERVVRLYDKFGEKFLRRVFLSREIEYCLKHENPSQYLAARIALKEAVSKAFGYGLGRKFQWKDVEIVKEGDRPKVIFHNKILKAFNDLECDCRVSISHQEKNSVAIAILETWE